MYRFPMAVALLLAVVASGCGRKVNPQEAKAVAAIEKLGGTVTVDEKERGDSSH